MASFDFEGHEIYYESHGEGDALLVLNGIFMSCASWRAFVRPFSKRVRLLLLDMIDQGRSAKVDFEYTQELQARVVGAFLDELGLDSVNLMGISYGGEVAMRFASAHPERVKKLVLSNTTAYTGDWLRDIGRSWEYAFESHDGRRFFKTCIPMVYSPRFYEDNYAWISAREDTFVKTFSPEVYDAFGRLTRSAETHDMRSALHTIKAQTLVISSEHDYVTPPERQREIARAIPGAGQVMIPDSGHGVMYEKPNEFLSAVLGFVENETDVRIV